MTHTLRQASLHGLAGQSLVLPLVPPDLPEEIEVFGRRWQRKRELHVTAVPAAAVPESEGAWDTVLRVAMSRELGPVRVGPEVRRVHHPDEPGLETLVVMVELLGLTELFTDLSAALGVGLAPPPAHITLYSTDPARGIGLANDRELHERAPALPEDHQEAARRAMRFSEAFFDDEGIPAAPTHAGLLALGGTDPVFTPRALEALAYAAHVHQAQQRKGSGTPYLAHLLSVAALVAEDGGGETEVMGALLHDTAEDHGGEPRLRDVRRRFGGEVESLVRALSDSLAGEDEPKAPWRPRKESYLQRLRAEPDAMALRIANADKLHNARAILADLRAIGEDLWGRFQAEGDEQIWYLGELSDIFTERRPGSMLARELAEVVAQLRAHRGGG